MITTEAGSPRPLCFAWVKGDEHTRQGPAAAVGLGDAGGGVRGFIGVDVFVSAGVGVDVVVAVVDVDNGVYVEVVVVGIHVGGVGDVGAGNQMFCNLLLQVDDKAIAPAVAIIY